MIKLYLEKLYRYDRAAAHMAVAVPVKKGRLLSVDEVSVWDENQKLTTQVKVTSQYDDGSIRFLFVRFEGNLPGMKEKYFTLFLDESDRREYLGNICEIGAGEQPFEVAKAEACAEKDEMTMVVKKTADGYEISTGAVSFEVTDYSTSVLTGLTYGERHFDETSFEGPNLIDDCNGSYSFELKKWDIAETGKLCTILKAEGTLASGNEGCEEGRYAGVELTITAFRGKSWLDFSVRLINTSEQPLNIKSFTMPVRLDAGELISGYIENEKLHADSTGCGDINYPLLKDEDGIYNTMGVSDLERIQELLDKDALDKRFAVARSNYRTDFKISKESPLVRFAGSKLLLSEGNEHFAEVFYGTFFADYTDSDMGVCATILKAQQNYPKAVAVNEAGISIMLVPECEDKVVMQGGTSREQSFRLHFHDKAMKLADIDNESLIYQMPDRPIVAPEVFRETGAMSDVFADKKCEAFECMLMAKADTHARSFGMMNFGDTIDWHYTEQGRGGDKAVWINNEYDYPHACALMYIRSGERRYLDYLITHAQHWMDVDVCHYSSDPFRIGGQIEHTAGHTLMGAIVPSHEWCEGLLDYYHFTGDERGLKTAIGIGENVLRLLEKPEYKNAGEANARETGWALRLLTALYIETNDKKWIEKCDWIVGHFKSWQEEFSNWSAQYTDNIYARTGFMISVAVGSLMRYYRVFPSEELKKLIMDAVDDIYENCGLDNGLFYYKELPSLRRNGSNPLLLESMAVGYELTGDTKYLLKGRRTLIEIVKSSKGAFGGKKKKVEDSVVSGNDSTKNFAQCMYPLTIFYKYLAEAGLHEILNNY